MPAQLRLAIQKSGRLSDDSIDLLKHCGIRFSHPKGRLRAVAHNFPVEVLYLRDDDIPGYVADGVADLGIVGQNVVLEKGHVVREIRALGFGKCRLAVAIPRGDAYEGIQSLSGRHIATSYPNLLGTYLSERGVEASIHEISGSVEIAPGIGLADGICDLVSTGSTLLSNGLVEVETILKSEAVLVSNPELSADKQALLDQITFRMDAVMRSRGSRYILLNAPNSAVERIKDLLPGMRSPTVVPLADEGWSSVHSVIKDDEFWSVVDQLKDAGAEGMLVVPIEKMVL
ncbi:MAG: ATP phosphoribosyltransferase [Rhodothermales bacterium]|nr:ATP phosphoribosyltransferase [Rhodothermales bacterium]MBO6778289.1 ATP phosphoribosyltransferase [Rhodothermales bacterium]